MALASLKQINIEGEFYTYLPIDVAIKYSDKIRSGFFVPLNEKKRVRIEFGESDLKGKLLDYKEKGLESILFAEEDYNLFLNAIKRGLTGFFFKEDENSKGLSLQQILFLVRKSIIYVGLEERFADLGEENVHKFFTWIKGAPKLQPQFKTFLRENQEQFIINIFASYVGIALAEQLNWPPHIAEKITQASLLGDICLSEDDYLTCIAANGDRTKWTKKFREHPMIMAKQLERHHSHTISREVIRAVEQHQEFPDGSGFPQALKGLSIDQLSAIIIIARTFTDAMVESDFAYDNRKEFVDQLLAEKFEYNNFKNPTKALYRVMGVEEEEQKEKLSG